MEKTIKVEDEVKPTIVNPLQSDTLLEKFCFQTIVSIELENGKSVAFRLFGLPIAILCQQKVYLSCEVGIGNHFKVTDLYKLTQKKLDNGNKFLLFEILPKTNVVYLEFKVDE